MGPVEILLWEDVGPFQLFLVVWLIYGGSSSTHLQCVCVCVCVRGCVSYRIFTLCIFSLYDAHFMAILYIITASSMNILFCLLC